jgi:hypothetical protein
MLYHNDDGSHLVVTNNPKYGKNQQQKERFASMRHVQKQPQQRKFQQQGSGSNGGGGATATPHDGSSGGGGGGDYKHEGDTILTEHRCTSSTVETRDGTQVVGVYGKDGQKWNFGGKQHLISSTDSHTITSKAVQMTSQTISLQGSTGVAITGPTSVNGNPVATTDMIAKLEARIAELEARLT